MTSLELGNAFKLGANAVLSSMVCSSVALTEHER